MKKTIALLLAVSMCFGLLAACRKTETGGNSGTATGAPDDNPTDVPTEAPTEEPKKTIGVSAASLSDAMKPLFSGTTMANETVMFLDKGDTRSLLFPIEEIISVTNYAGTKEYTRGEDYDLVDGKIVCLAGSKIPCITSEKYYGADSSSYLKTKNPEGKEVYTYWGEGQTMTNWQVNVTYTHKDNWDGFRQPCEIDKYEELIKKLQNHENVTFIFYGDSITHGANASFIVGCKPGLHPYTMLFTEAIADLFGYKVEYTKVNKLSGTPKIPTKPYNIDNEPTITYINPSVGGWSSADGLNNYDKYIKPYIEEHGCDLFCLAFGMNDGGSQPDSIYATQKKIMDKVITDAPKASLMFISTMVPNNKATNGWYGSQEKQEARLITGAEEDYNSKGIPCSVARVGSTSLSILEHKEFYDYTGNNINHPNDFFTRVYAQTLFSTLIGYENLD